MNPEAVYRNQFSTDDVVRHEREFENGIGRGNEEFAVDANDPLARPSESMTLIKTPGAKSKKDAQSYNSIAALPLTTFSFSMASMTGIKPEKRRRQPKPKSSSSKKSTKKANDNDDYVPSHENDDDDDDDEEEVVFGNDDHNANVAENGNQALQQGMNSIANNERMLRSMVEKKRNTDVASKEVVADGGGDGEMPVPIKFVSLREASRRQAEKNFTSMTTECDELCYSSCDELERKIAEEEEKKRQLYQRLSEKDSGVAPESLDEDSFSNSSSRSTSSSERRKRKVKSGHSPRSHDDDNDDDDDDDDMYYSTSESISHSNSRRKKSGGGSADNFKTPSMTHSTAEDEDNRVVRHGGGGGGGGDKGPPNKPFGNIAGRNISSSMNCFLCRRGDKKYDSVNRKDMLDLLDLLEKGVGHTDPLALAKQVHLQYMKTIYIDGKNGSTDVPLWRTKSVLEHILYHENDPRYVLWLSIVNSRRTIDCLKETSFVIHPQNGEIVPTKNLELRQKEEAHLLNLYRQKAETMVFFQPGSQIDLGKNNKRVHGVVQKDGKRHYAHTEVAELDR